MNVVQPKAGKTRQISSRVQTDYSSVAYWYQSEPHAAFPAFPSPEERLPTPVGQSQLQFALLTSPLWIPAAALGRKARNP
jgi:hypothetical protein